MEQSANLQLPYIMPSQAQKHVTHNEAIRMLDALVQLAVKDRDLDAPPAVPVDGDRYLVATGGTGAWAGKGAQVAAWQDGAWSYLMPRAGWLAWVVDEQLLLGFDGTGWVDAAVHSVNPTELVGVNATADTGNRLAVKSPATLFDQETGDHRMKINKAAPGDTASVVFQSGYSGRAEFGLAGDDDWHVKVSPDGSAWTEALKVDRANGQVRLPAALPLSDDNQVVARRHIREKLTGNRTYYVRTDGSDSNTGLVDSSAGAFLTIQKALTVVLGTLDLAGFNVTIDVASGTYAGSISFASPQVGAGNITIDGDTTTPSNVTVGPITVDGAGCRLFVQGLNVGKGSGNYCCQATNGSFVRTTGKNQFSSASGGHRLHATAGGRIEAVAPEVIQGTVAGGHYYADQKGTIYCQGATWTASGTAAQGWFAAATDGTVYAFSNSSSGTFTGLRYLAQLNGVVTSNGGGASYFPGSAVGSTASGGQYA